MFQKISILRSSINVFLLLAVFCNGVTHAQVQSRVTPVVRAVQVTKNSVVNISTNEVRKRINPFSRFGNDPFFDRFFNDYFSGDYGNKSIRSTLGSGVIIDPSGYVVTNWHVVERSTSITVITSDEHEYSATLVGADPRSDLAVLKIESDTVFDSVKTGNSDDLLIGESVIAIGNPFGLTHTVTTGVVSAVNRSVKADEQVYENFIQTDASINPGNSGGPLLNINGELIGINTAIYGQAEGIGFAIPVNRVLSIVRDLVAYGEVRPPWIGTSVDEVPRNVADYLGYTENYGVIVSDVTANGPADKAGLKTSDIIMSVNGKKIKSKASFKRMLGLFTADDSVEILYYRNGSQRKTTVVLTEFPAHYVESLCWDSFGFRYIANSSGLAKKYGLYSTDGIVISETRRNGQAQQIGLQPGDIIVQVQSGTTDSLDDFKKQIVSNIHRETIVMLVQRGPYGYYVTFYL